MIAPIIICFKEGQDSGMLSTEVGKQEAAGNNSEEHFRTLSLGNGIGGKSVPTPPRKSHGGSQQ